MFKEDIKILKLFNFVCFICFIIKYMLSKISVNIHILLEIDH